MLKAFNIKYKLWTTVKGQILANLVVKFTKINYWRAPSRSVTSIKIS